MIKKLLMLATLLIFPNTAAASSGKFDAPAKVVLMMLEGTRTPCKDFPPNMDGYQAACATVPLDAEAFKQQWSMVGELPFTNLFIVSDWKADVAGLGSFSRAYTLGGKPLVVSYHPTGKSGRVQLIYTTGPQPASDVPVLPARPASTLKFQSCEAALAAGYRNMRRGQPGYSRKLDPNNDGIACNR